MLTGIFAGITWALETVILGIALAASPFCKTEEAVLLAPFVSTFLHDAFSSLYMLIYNVFSGGIKNLGNILKTKSLVWLILASCIGGPVGMTGYVLAVKYMGASLGAVASAIYPAIGTLLAFIFLKEKVRWYQWIFLIITLGGVYGLSYSPNIDITNFWLGLLGVFMCALGWGVEAVILAKCFGDSNIKNSEALWIRQTVSAIIYGAIILPLLGGIKFTVTIFTENITTVIPIIAAAALFATISYLLYYKAIATLGASRAMALNITYTAWAIFFTVIILKDFSVLNPLTLCCTAGVIVCGVASAADLKSLFAHKKSTH